MGTKATSRDERLLWDLLRHDEDGEREHLTEREREPSCNEEDALPCLCER